jgi:nucleotide-binding universal stress UspA family protein
MAGEVIVGYDGSPSAAAAIEVAARLLPGRAAHVVYLWTAPFADAELRKRLWPRARSVDDLIELLEREGGAEAERLAADGVALARAAGWQAEALLHRTFGGEGLELARLAGERGAPVVVVGARGLSGIRAVLGSVSDVVVHFSPVPVLVIPHPLLSDERAAAEAGPVLVAYDGSRGARAAVTAAALLFAGRPMIVATVSRPGVRPVEDALLCVLGADHAETVVVDARANRSGEGRMIAEAIAGVAAERGAAAVVSGSRGQSVHREILLGSVAMALLHHAHRPVVVVPGEPDPQQG